MFLSDLHVHSTYSDGSLTIGQLVDFYGERGFGCIAITDHLCERATIMGLAARYMKVTLTETTFPDYLHEIEREAERAWDRYRLLVLPGFELTKNTFSNHRSAHILGIGVKALVDPAGDVTDLARAIRAQGGLAVAAHPVPTGKAEIQTLHLWHRRRELATEFDAWEVASGAEYFDEVEDSGLPLLATSDFHHPQNIRGWKSVFDCERRLEAVLDCVRKQKLDFHFYR